VSGSLSTYTGLTCLGPLPCLSAGLVGVCVRHPRSPAIGLLDRGISTLPVPGKGTCISAATEGLATQRAVMMTVAFRTRAASIWSALKTDDSSRYLLTSPFGLFCPGYRYLRWKPAVRQNQSFDGGDNQVTALCSRLERYPRSPDLPRRTSLSGKPFNGTRHLLVIQGGAVTPRMPRLSGDNYLRVVR